MIGSIGFSVGALAVGIFAVTAHRAYRSLSPRNLSLFCSAFGMLAVAMVVWAFAATDYSDQTISTLLFASDALLISATICMALTLVKSASPLFYVAGAAIGSLLLALRFEYYPPTGFVRDGLLHFNLHGGVRTILIGLFVFVWLMAMIRVAQQITRNATLAPLRSALIINFAAIVAAVALFLSARRSSIIISLFIVIVGLFLTLSAINVLLQRIPRSTVPATKHRKKESVHGAK